MYEVAFKNRKLNKNKLTAFGFNEQNEYYIYYCHLLDGQMKMTVTISQDGKIFTEVLDSVGEEYLLHLVPNAVGSFVGQIKAEYEEILEKISSNCFDSDVFKSEYAKKLIVFVREKYGDEPEFLWEKFPDNAVLRRKDTKKWYAALLTVSKRKLGLKSDETVEILDLRMNPEDINILTDNKKYFPGYHMNKKHWITILLDGSVSFEEICGRITASYEIAVK